MAKMQMLYKPMIHRSRDVRFPVAMKFKISSLWFGSSSTCLKASRYDTMRADGLVLIARAAAGAYSTEYGAVCIFDQYGAGLR